MTTFVRIDNQIVEKIGKSGFCISPIKLFQIRYKKNNNISLDLEHIPYISTGSKKLDTRILSSLLGGSVKFEELDIIYPTHKINLFK